MYAGRLLDRRGREFPPTADELVIWSRLFRCHGTFSNYLGHTKLACQLLGESVSAFDSPDVKRAKASVKKRDGFMERHKRFITHAMVEKIVTHAKINGGASDKVGAMLFLATYVFMLRLPSEALPMAKKRNGSLGQAQHSALYLDGDELCLQLKHRKNRPRGATLRRRCWCKECETTCPVHALWPFIEQCSDAMLPQPFISARITPSFALKQLRCALGVAVGVPDAEKYRTHDLRRGHANDMLRNGSTVNEILAAGQWRSPAFLRYLDLEELERDAVVEAHVYDSSSEEDS